MKWKIKPNGNGTFLITPPGNKINMSKREISKLIVALRQVIFGELDDGSHGVFDFAAPPTVDIRSIDMR